MAYHVLRQSTHHQPHRGAVDPVARHLYDIRDANGNGTWDLDQARTSNTVNEITDITETAGPAWATPAYNRAGNMTTVPKPSSLTTAYTATHDAWNRLVKLADGSDTVSEYAYDGAKRRIVQLSYVAGTLSETRYLYYTDPSQWQVVEERLGASTDAERQFVWGLRYVDDCLLRDRDSDANGSLDERLYALQDGNWNVTGLVDPDGDVLERFAYTAYGVPLFLAANFTPQGASGSGWEPLYCGYRYETATGLFHVRHRVLHPVLGAWVQRDPLGSSAGPALYTYCKSLPPSRTDATGLIASNLIIIRDQSRQRGIPHGFLDELIRHGNTGWGIRPGNPKYNGSWNTIYLPDGKFPDNYWVRPSSYWAKRRAARTGRTISPDLNCAQLAIIYNELWHAWWDQVLEELEECRWLHEFFLQEAARLWPGPDSAEMADEAASETVTNIISHLCTGGKPTYDSCATGPIHDGPGEKWDGNSLADIKLSQKMYDVVMHALPVRMQTGNHLDAAQTMISKDSISLSKNIRSHGEASRNTNRWTRGWQRPSRKWACLALAAIALAAGALAAVIGPMSKVHEMEISAIDLSLRHTVYHSIPFTRHKIGSATVTYRKTSLSEFFETHGISRAVIPGDGRPKYMPVYSAGPLIEQRKEWPYHMYYYIYGSGREQAIMKWSEKNVGDSTNAWRSFLEKFASLELEAAHVELLNIGSQSAHAATAD
ncbi:MAG: RHS repeat protein [Planctomyces sp.]|nr:RHS repeat protein [Planctomyces sp.]